ncbi:MAG: LPS assembly lipoprotein LptE [Myxococcota bacterium]
MSRFASIAWAALARVALSGVALFSVGTGCGYTWAGASDAPQLGAVAIETPRNASGEGGLHFVVADALRREVMRRPGARLTEDPDGADWVVAGQVLPLRVAAASLSPVVLTLEYELTLGLDLTATATDGRELRFDPQRFRETERFLASADAEAQRKNRVEALRRISRTLAARFLDQLAVSAATPEPGPPGDPS